MILPKWTKKHLSENDLTEIEEAIRQAEKTTSGEIVPVIVHRSSTIGHVPVILFLFLFSLYMLFEVNGHLDHYFSLGDLGMLIGLVIIFILSFLLSGLNVVQRFCTSAQDMDSQVVRRAEFEFYESKIKKTEGATGILLFISLMERRAVVLADKAISEKCPVDTWQAVINLMIAGIKKGRLKGGLVKGIKKCGELLSSSFPILENDINELPNHLVIKDC